MNHKGIVGVEEEGNALLPTQIGNVHLQVKETQVVTSCLSPSSKSVPSCEEGMCQKGSRRCVTSLAVICSSSSPGQSVLLSIDDRPQLSVQPCMKQTKQQPPIHHPACIAVSLDWHVTSHDMRNCLNSAKTSASSPK